MLFRSLRLWPAMHVQDQRIFLVRIEIVRFDDEDLDSCSAGAVDPNLFGGTNVHVGRDSVVYVSDLPGSASLPVADIGAEHLDRLSDRTACVEQTRPTASDTPLEDRLVGQHLSDCFRSEVDAIDRRLSFNRSAEVNRLGVICPLKLVDPVSERFGENRRRPGRAIIDSQPKQIRFVRGLLLHSIRDVLAVWRILRAAVVGRVRCGDVSRRGLRIDERDQPKIVVGRRRWLLVVIRYIDELFSVG